MILVVEPSLKGVRFWTFKERAGRILPSLVVKDFQEVVDKGALKKMVRSLIGKGRLEAVSFRIFFGGDTFKGPTLISEPFFKKFEGLVSFMPFYIPFTCRLLRVFYEEFKKVPLIAFFETAFFQGLPDEEKYYAVPQEHFQKTNLKRYGFHGIYHEFNAETADNKDRILSIVMDKQTTVCAIHKGRPESISLGYTPLEGIMGRTSCGDLDPGIVFYMMKRYKFSIFKMDDILKRESGFVGMTGYDLTFGEFFKLYGCDPKVTLAFDVYQNQILRYIGEGISLLGGLDSIIFSGCHISLLMPLVYRIVKKISFLGIDVKPLPWALKDDFSCISKDDSKVKARINFSALPAVLYYKAKDICGAAQ